MIEAIIAFLLGAWLVIKSLGHSTGLFDMPNIFHIHQQISWLMVILLIISSRLSNIFEKQKSLLSCINNKLDLIYKTEEPENSTNDENIKEVIEQSKESKKQGYYILLSIIIIFAITIFCLAFNQNINNKNNDVKPINNAHHVNMDNTHIPATDMYK